MGYAYTIVWPHRLSRCDTSGDGKISLEEFLKEMGVEEQAQPEPAVKLEEKHEIVTQTTTL